MGDRKMGDREMDDREMDDREMDDRKMDDRKMGGRRQEAEIDGETVVVSAEEATPVAVRFGWHKEANPILVNGAGLPVAPFHSDNWQGGTGE